MQRLLFCALGAALFALYGSATDIIARTFDAMNALRGYVRARL